MKSLSSIIKNKNDKSEKPYFQEDVFYPRLHDKEKEINEAKKKALEIIQGAESQVGELLAKFQQEGTQKGLTEVAPLRGLLTNLLEEFKEFKVKAAKDLHPIVVDLAFQISKKVIKDEIQTNPEIVTKNAKAALETLIDKEHIILQVNPADKKLMEKHEKEIMKLFRDIKSLKIEGKESISRGGCYIRSDRGDVDATIETQFSEVAKSFAKSEKL